MGGKARRGRPREEAVKAAIVELVALSSDNFTKDRGLCKADNAVTHWDPDFLF